MLRLCIVNACVVGAPASSCPQAQPLPRAAFMGVQAGSMKETMTRSPESPVEFNASVLDVIRGWLAQRIS